MELLPILIDIEDKLLPYFHCDIWERGLYYYLFRQTHLKGNESATIPLSSIATALGCSEWQARKSVRQLAQKGCIELEQTRKGHKVKVLLPNQLGIPDVSNEKVDVDIESLDFFSNRIYVEALLDRENHQCFYCLRKITDENCELDHVIPLVGGGSNNYTNIVASCHRCNTIKQGNSAEQHIRQLYRNNLLDQNEFNSRLKAIEDLKNGRLKPSL